MIQYQGALIVGALIGAALAVLSIVWMLISERKALVERQRREEERYADD